MKRWKNMKTEEKVERLRIYDIINTLYIIIIMIIILCMQLGVD